MELKKFREKKGVLQSDVAKALGINNSTYAYYERGEHSPGPDMLCKLADFFGVTVDEILGRTSEPGIFDNARIEQPEILQLYERMTPEEQNTLVNDARGLISGRELRASYENRKNRPA